MFYHESWQNDICSFRAMTIALTVSFKLISFYHFIEDSVVLVMWDVVDCILCLMHGSDTWPMKVEHELKLNRTVMSMIRWMCRVKLYERKKSEELRTLRIGTSQFDDQKEEIQMVWTC